jgi:hypothetical protein
MCQCELSSGSFFRVDRMTLPPCVSPDLNANGCNCSPSRPQVSRQWPGHPYPGPSTLFANPSTTTPSRFAFPQFPSTSFHHAGAPHEPTKLHDPRNLHGTQGYTNIPRTLFPQTLYNTPTRRIQHPKPIIIGLQPTLYLPLCREFLPLQTTENVKTTQRGEVGHVNASSSLRLS